MGVAGSIVGIDLGTTMSVVSHLDSSHLASTIPNRDGDPLTPSAVYLDGSNVVVGKAAKDAASHYPGKVATLVKRDMGKPVYSRLIDGRNFRPEVLSAIILRKLKQDAERRIGDISGAVITVPAFFDDARRKATRDAGLIAGLDVIDIVNEPTAAALTYSLNGRLGKNTRAGEGTASEKSLTALVYDLGGGTFDVTVVRLVNKEVTTVAIDGEVQLGGKDWDDRIIQYVGKKFLEKHGIDPLKDPARYASIASMAETAKKLLSQLPSAPIECFHEGHLLEASLDVKTFEEITEDLLARSEIVTNLVVQQAKMSWNDIDKVLMVGGSTRIPAVSRMLKKMSGFEPDDSLDPDQVVSHGAAIYGNVLASRESETDLEIADDLRNELADVIIQDVNAHSLGIQTVNRKSKQALNTVLIQKNTQLPYANSKVFAIVKAGARTVTVKVLEGEAEQAENNQLMGHCRVKDLPPNLPKKSPIQVRLGYDPNGIVSVMALDMTGGGYAKTEFRRENGLNDNDIEEHQKFVEQLTIS